MITINEIKEMQTLGRKTRRQGHRSVLVPTMGYLHDGHLSLIRRAREEGDWVVVSLFVNPAQFGVNEDYRSYPRDLARDVVVCQQEGVDVLFAPTTDEMYNPDHEVMVDERDVATRLEGACRPGHFQGVLTIVAKLFHAVLPDVAVFGEKDAQQLWLIRRMIRDLNFPIEIVTGATIRESDGLALSSRNVYLKGPQREQATCLYRALQAATEACRNGEQNVYAVRKVMADIIDHTPEAYLEYAEIMDLELFAPVTIIQKPCLALIAARIGYTRLIDNMVLRPEETV